ncbi:MAG: hypothetical protein AAFP90_04855, partial [Planctomycetota bacterium]
MSDSATPNADTSQPATPDAAVDTSQTANRDAASPQLPLATNAISQNLDHGSCCQWLPSTGQMVSLGALILIVAASACAATSLMMPRQTANSHTNTPTLANAGDPFAGWIDATGAVSSDNYSMTTGSVSNEADGLFILDHESGNLQCVVLYPRMGSIGATFTANVNEALAGGKGGKYLMVTGSANFPTSSRNPVAQTVIYVLDTSTGNYVGYGFPFNRQMANGNRPQSGPMV